MTRMQPMSKNERRTQTSRIVGTMTIAVGLLLSFTGAPVLAGLLVLIGVGLRIEAAVTAGR
ncbi:hypothetical protein [Actinoplanes couchii]|uniref:Integral membrane protein n=1 Tax=Actinoplanes couchii TaxID=403638 RepID=A0ABQ3XPN7_9ACTN|nr:hypothetical protein [Actinoplanes couchii]MDR6319113.1 hypothetical protein [Actinoplanes couchii]GID60454.1 hypothetical protein Aco03nite_088580 [Actinoplanes couchii]